MKKLLYSILLCFGTVLAPPKANACQCFRTPHNILESINYRLQAGNNSQDIYILKAKITDTFITNWGGLLELGFKLQILQQYSGGTTLADTVILCNSTGTDCYGNPYFAIGDTVILDGGIHTVDSIDYSPCNFSTVIHNDTICNIYVTDTVVTTSCFSASSLTDSINNLLQTLAVDNPADLKNAFQVYPNPARESIHLNYPSSLHIKSVQLIDITGKIIKTYYDNFNTLNAMTTASGMYYLRVNAIEGSTIKKVVVE